MDPQAHTSAATASHRSAPSLGPIPIIVVRRDDDPASDVSDLQRDSRLEVLVTVELTPTWIAIAHRTCAVFAVTAGDPWNALIYVITANVHTPVVVVHDARYSDSAGDLTAAGALATITAPIRRASLDAVLPRLHRHSGSAHVDSHWHMVLDPIARTVRYRDVCIMLSPRQFAILHTLSTHDGRAVSADDLMISVWGHSSCPQRTRQMLDVYIFQLRRKFARAGLHSMITTVRGYGYSLKAPQ